jgi:hypothetical protein
MLRSRLRRQRSLAQRWPHSFFVELFQIFGRSCDKSCSRAVPGSEHLFVSHSIDEISFTFFETNDTDVRVASVSNDFFQYFLPSFLNLEPDFQFIAITGKIS